MTKPKFLLSKRMVSPRFWSNPELADLETQSGIRNLRLTMIGLWAIADEAGIFEWEPRTLAGLIYPYSPEDQKAMTATLEAFVEKKFLNKIEVEGKFYGVWPNWGEHNDFRNKNQSRYPEVLTLINPQMPSETLARVPTPSNPLLKKEGEVEGEALPPTQTNIQSAKPSGGQEASIPTPPAPSGDGGPAERLARLLFKLLDQPRDQVKNAGLWETQVAALLKDHPEDEIAAVMEHGVKNDTFSAEYLTIAKEPMKSFVKTYDNIHKGWKALQKGAAAAANREAKLAKRVSAPGSHGNDSGFEL